MADEVAPALTPGQWADYQSLHVNYSRWISWEAGTGYIPYPHQHAVAAMLLLGQPYGFTWSDVDELCMIANVNDGEFQEENLMIGAESRRIFLSLADRIAALLPPRT